MCNCKSVTVLVRSTYTGSGAADPSKTYGVSVRLLVLALQQVAGEQTATNTTYMLLFFFVCLFVSLVFSSLSSCILVVTLQMKEGD